MGHSREIILSKLEPTFKVSKFDLLIALMAAHLVQDAINPRYISLDKDPRMYLVAVGGVTAVITLLSALASFVRAPRVRD